ncbi:uncharacterized protein LOC129984787 [Argiope bruennichi]|uniref:uncharacterized protein LOC129984787 n=1 Tax=Argiope bruennichi TaxID=94029 RepID=UPI00249507D0|nr:uncharacterized protein LOC129984787 [Argiope bruennichi]
MREGTRGHLLSIFCAFWCTVLLQIDARNQQTFVVRYKNGEHTVPVTVVLDYKKQTEYVINMSPRAATKTVTLYDFKQKTIAYKDLTNRECFLGRLTHETLNEETDALTKIQNPVERQPKVLSLNPQRPSLTPTEIRNMAGQKTAIFCGKMNTWLVLPKEKHTLQKREVDEVEERTFHRHGYHTVQYSHFGRDTRRRYRNPANRQFFQRRTDTSEIPDWKAGNSETAFGNGGKSLEPPSFQQQFLNPSLSERAFNENNQGIHHPEVPLINGKGAQHFDPTFHPASIAEDYNSGKAVSFASPPGGLNGQNEYEQHFPYNPAISETPNFPEDSEGSKDSRRRNFSNLKNINIVNGASANENISSVSKNKPFYPIIQSNLFNPEMIAAKPSVNQQNGNHAFDLNRDHRQIGAEGESIPFGYDLNGSRKNIYSESSDIHGIPDDTDVSSNVLETLKATKKPDNIGKSLHQPTILETKEDVHDVFEGFFNLRKSNPPSEQLTYNSHFIPPEPNERREHHLPDESLINSYPSLPQTKQNDNTDKKQQWGKNEIITSTDNPSLKTDYNSSFSETAISPIYFNSFSDSRTLRHKPENSDDLISTPQKVGQISKSWTTELLQPVTSKSKNIFNEVVDEYFTSENPLYASAVKEHSAIRSIDSKPNETVINITSTNLSENLQELQNSFPSEIQEGRALQKIRFQNVLRSYTPDQIIIDVEKIPTQRPPESTLDFQGRVYSPNSNISPNVSNNINGSKSEQTSGDTWRGKPIRKTSLPSRKTHNLLPDIINFGSRIPQQDKRNESNRFQHRAYGKNVRQLIYPNSQTLSHPVYNVHRSYRLDSLPPGVSIHPRHPKAPYAHTVHSKTLPPVPQVRTPKLHRHRHNKKKDRLMNSCCRTREKTKGCCASCCRGKAMHTKPPCCSSLKPSKNQQRQKQMLITHTPAPQQVRKIVEDRCQKEKLCRTLYESTQQVMVCRNAKIDGC